ncbi:phosphotransferase family protein [Kitasatospora brasiliensis]|uniref:phosphotransferase family protein n=1 Tax=Kitasatospora brasiliensis TaxID=3058040 RepID=UPI00292FDE1C|nr:aminoglycoside phosphotransferase family protein [Kitasatospora sp. K002]
MIDDGGPWGQGWDGTRRWVQGHLAPGERIARVSALKGGWTSRMRRLDVECAGTGPYALVLRSFVKPFYRRHAPALLAREAGVLRLLEDSTVPAARLVGVDGEGAACEHPSLVMTHLPGGVRLAEDGEAPARAALLAAQLAAVHALEVGERERPRTWQAWTAADRVVVPEGTGRARLWARAVEVIDAAAPAWQGCFLHRDFHPGNVLFTGSGGQLAISGVVDWVETSWGPADLDVAHCSTALALLHGPEAGLAFADRYTAAGGRALATGRDHLYWRLLDALAFAPDAQKVAEPWRELGRVDLTPPVLAKRLEDYVQALFDRYA